MLSRAFPARVVTVATVIAALTAVRLTVHTHAQSQATSRGGERADYANFDGIWETTYGRLVLAQDGNKVRGTYGYMTGRIEGEVDGTTLEFVWSELPDRNDPSHRGNGSFSLSADRKSFEGVWRFESLPGEQQWNGYFAAPRAVEGVRPNPDYCLWRGFWEIEAGSLAFFQELQSSAVTGEFIGPGGYGTLAGTASGWELDFTYETGTDSGSGHVEMTSDLSAFSGRLTSRTGAWQPFAGSFLSAGQRADFEGTWQTNLGQLLLQYNVADGNVTGTLRSASINGVSGTVTLTGRVVGGAFGFEWELRSDSVSMRGQGILRIAEGGRIKGSLWLDGQSETQQTTISGTRAKL